MAGAVDVAGGITKQQALRVSEVRILGESVQDEVIICVAHNLSYIINLPHIICVVHTQPVSHIICVAHNLQHVFVVRQFSCRCNLECIILFHFINYKIKIV